MFSVRVFEVSRVNPKAEPKELRAFEVPSDSHDQAKEQARNYLTAQGHAVRSLSWGPGIDEDMHVLLAYVYAKA